jgi:hypothetical protein
MTVKSVVTKFGGQSALARRIGRRPSVVAYWVKASTIPSRWHPVLLQIAAAEGIYLTANELVAQDEPKEVLTGTVLPVAKYPGSFRVENFTINCYVLNDGRRIISRTSATDFLTDARGGGNLESYIGIRDLELYVPSHWQQDLVEFSLPEVTNKQPQGITAETFLGICRAYMRARDDGALASERQVEIAKRAGAFVFACSAVGITALIDEATGFQYERAEDALQFKLRLYLEDEMRAWEKTFPDRLWEEFGRLTGWEDPISSRPKYWGKLVMEMVYGYLDLDVAEWLKENAPQPRHGQNYHQWLSSQYGLKKLTEHLWMLIGIATTCETMPELRRRMGERFGKIPVQLMLFTEIPN